MALFGKDFVFYVEHEGVSKPVVCGNSGTLSITQDTKEATKGTQSRWRSNYAYMLGYSIQVDGVCNIDGSGVSGLELYNLIISGNSVKWVATDANNPSYHFDGYIVPTSLTFDSPPDSLLTFSFGAVGDGSIGATAPTGYYALEYGIEYH